MITMHLYKNMISTFIAIVQKDIIAYFPHFRHKVKLVSMWSFCTAKVDELILMLDTTVSSLDERSFIRL